MWGVEWSGFSATADNAFLIAFPSLFSIINPIGGALLFEGFTRGFSHADRTRVAALVGFYSLLIMFGALWTGAYVLNFFGVSLDALRIAGGLVVASSGWRLLNSVDHRKNRGQEVAEEDADGDPMQMAFFPLTLPITTGPGTIAVAITLGAERPPYGFGLLSFFVGMSLAAIANAAIIWIAYRFADRVITLFGATARLIVVRLSAFLLMSIGVQILLTAVGDLVTKWRVA